MHRQIRIPQYSLFHRFSLIVFASLQLTGCGFLGGGGLTMDPREVQLEATIKKADTLLGSSVHLVLEGSSMLLSQKAVFSCDGSICRTNDEILISDEEFTLEELFSSDTYLTDISTEEMSGLNTGTIVERLDSWEFPGTTPVTFTKIPDSKNYGIWGKYGFAAVEIQNGPISGTFAGNAFDGEVGLTFAYSLGMATGSNPSVDGGATWTGITEAASTNTFERYSGTATVSITDLTDPMVNVQVDLIEVGPLSWSDVPLVEGRYQTGTPGMEYLAGDFYGSDHGETYGIFDTGAYVGAFGARRGAE